MSNIISNITVLVTTKDNPTLHDANEYSGMLDVVRYIFDRRVEYSIKHKCFRLESPFVINALHSIFLSMALNIQNEYRDMQEIKEFHNVMHTHSIDKMVVGYCSNIGCYNVGFGTGIIEIDINNRNFDIYYDHAYDLACYANRILDDSKRFRHFAKHRKALRDITFASLVIEHESIDVADYITFDTDYNNVTFYYGAYEDAVKDIVNKKMEQDLNVILKLKLQEYKDKLEDTERAALGCHENIINENT